jgi:hypothetical protein
MLQHVWFVLTRYSLPVKCYSRFKVLKPTRQRLSSRGSTVYVCCASVGVWWLCIDSYVPHVQLQENSLLEVQHCRQSLMLRGMNPWPWSMIHYIYFVHAAIGNNWVHKRTQNFYLKFKSWKVFGMWDNCEMWLAWVNSTDQWLNVVYDNTLTASCLGCGSAVESRVWCLMVIAVTPSHHTLFY